MIVGRVGSKTLKYVTLLLEQIRRKKDGGGIN